MGHSLIYVTVANREAALRIARSLVEQHLVACANVLDGATSVYRWEGKVEEAAEAVMVAKTVTAKVEEATTAIKALHDYSCPCIVALPIIAGNPAFLQWVSAETEE